MSMSDEPSPEEIEAIRAVIELGVGGDYHDVARVVKEKYGFQVGAGMVEDVYHKMQRGEFEEPSDRDSPRQPDRNPGEEILEKVIRFAQEMGGFEQARAALDAVEKRIRDLS